MSEAMFRWFCRACAEVWRAPAQLPVKCPHCKQWWCVDVLDDKGGSAPLNWQRGQI